MSLTHPQSGSLLERKDSSLILLTLCLSLLLLAICLGVMFCAWVTPRRGSEEPQTDQIKKTKENRRAEIKDLLAVFEWGIRSAADGCEDPVKAQGRCRRMTAATCEEFEETEDESDFDGLSSAECECSICLTSFQSDETVCKSNNHACSHVFHLECMTMWLMKHQECPLCRQDYVVRKEEV